ncbi:MAG: hypothetical protein ACLTER_19920 [Ruminococcus sp.]
MCVTREIRFAPLLSENSGMNCRAVIEAILKGLERGRADFGTEFGVITCAMRHHSQEDNSRMIKTAREYLGYGVCAADLAGAEAAYPMAQFMELFQNIGWRCLYPSCRRVWKRTGTLWML